MGPAQGAVLYLDEVYLDGVSREAVAIQSFADADVGRFFRDGRTPKGAGWTSVASVAARKLDMLEYADLLSDLASPPGNRLEALKGHLRGYHSVRVNAQWRIVFRWTASGPADVDIRDYH